MDKTDMDNAIWNRIDGVYREETDMNNYTTKSQKALGIDPGLANTGWAVLTRNRRGQFRILASGCLQTDKQDTEAKRYTEIYTGISDLIRKHSPDTVAIEKVFWNRNITSALTTAGVVSVCLLAAEQAGIASYQITPQKAKAFATGHGRASKKHVKKFVQKLTQTEIKNGHAADAAAIAIAGFLQQQVPKIL